MKTSFIRHIILAWVIITMPLLCHAESAIAIYTGYYSNGQATQGQTVFTLQNPFLLEFGKQTPSLQFAADSKPLIPNETITAARAEPLGHSAFNQSFLQLTLSGEGWAKFARFFNQWTDAPDSRTVLLLVHDKKIIHVARVDEISVYGGELLFFIASQERAEKLAQLMNSQKP